MEINPSLTGLDNLLALVNEANKTNYTSDDVRVDKIQPYSDTYSGANTSALLLGVSPQYYKNSAVVYYRRLDVGRTVVNPPAAYQIDETTTLADVAAMVANRLRLIPSEVVFSNFRTSETEATSYITVGARSNSPVYTGSIELPLVWSGSADLDLVALLEPGRLLHQLIHVTMPFDGYF